MARARRPGPIRVPIGLEVSAADAARIDQVLARPEFAGWTRAEWCLEIVRTALRYYMGAGTEAPEPEPGQARLAAAAPAAAKPAAAPAAARRTTPQPPPQPQPPQPQPPQPEPPQPEPELPDQLECPHPADARDYETGTCAACGAILWD